MASETVATIHKNIMGVMMTIATAGILWIADGVQNLKVNTAVAIQRIAEIDNSISYLREVDRRQWARIHALEMERKKLSDKSVVKSSL